MKGEEIKKITDILEEYPAVKLGYVFGSRARGDVGPLSDYDIAVYAEERDKIKLGQLRLGLHTRLVQAVSNDNVDVIMLNTAESPELKYNIISQGKLIYEQEPYKVLVEPRILNEYFDLRYFLLKYNLTKAP